MMGIGEEPGVNFVLEMQEMFQTRTESPTVADAAHRQSKMWTEN